MNPKRLHDRRKACRISQEKLGIAAGIDEYTAKNRVSKYEAGINAPSFALVQEFAKILDVPACYFYIIEDDFAEAVLQLYRQQQAPVLENVDNVKLKIAHTLTIDLAKKTEHITNELAQIISELEKKTRRDKINKTEK